MRVVEFTHPVGLRYVHSLLDAAHCVGLLLPPSASCMSQPQPRTLLPFCSSDVLKFTYIGSFPIYTRKLFLMPEVSSPSPPVPFARACFLCISDE